MMELLNTPLLIIIVTVIILAIVFLAAMRYKMYVGGHEQIEIGAAEKMDLVELDKANAAQIAQFAEIMSRPENTRALGTGEAWTAEKISAFVEHAREDAAAGNTTYMHWLICADGAVVGYVSLRPFTAAQSQFRYVVDPAFRGRGYAKWAVHLLARAGHWFVVDPANAASINVAMAAGAKPAGKKYIKGKQYDLYRVQ